MVWAAYRTYPHTPTFKSTGSAFLLSVSVKLQLMHSTMSITVKYLTNFGSKIGSPCICVWCRSWTRFLKCWFYVVNKNYTRTTCIKFLGIAKVILEKAGRQSTKQLSQAEWPDEQVFKQGGLVRLSEQPKGSVDLCNRQDFGLTCHIFQSQRSSKKTEVSISQQLRRDFHHSSS